jgi:hypothetical protein
LNDLLPILLIIFMAMFLLRDRGSRGGSPMMTPGGGGCFPEGPAAAWLASLHQQQRARQRGELPIQAGRSARLRQPTHHISVWLPHGEHKSLHWSHAPSRSDVSINKHAKVSNAQSSVA